jgi:hypothetical protein
VVVKVRNDCTGWSWRSSGTATRCVVAPQSMPAASGLIRSSTVDEGLGGDVDDEARTRPSDASSQLRHPGTGSTKTNRLPHGITTEVASPAMSTSLPGPRYSTGTSGAPVSRQPSARMRPPSYAGSSRSLAASSFSADVLWYHHVHR